MGVAPDFERFGRCARAAWAHAADTYEGAEVLRHGVTTAHLLLGVLHEESCAGGLILRALGLDLRLAYAMTEFVLVYGRQPAEATQGIAWGGLPHTMAAHRVLEGALEEAEQFSSTYPIGTEHLLLGVLRVPEGFGYQILDYLGIKEANARATRDRLWSVLSTAEQ